VPAGAVSAAGVSAGAASAFADSMAAHCVAHSESRKKHLIGLNSVLSGVVPKVSAGGKRYVMDSLHKA
jgi:hypothetical protein